MAVLIPVECPACGDTETIVKFGRTHNEKQRYRCQSAECKKPTFIVDHERKGWLPEIKEKIIAMTLNTLSGIRDISRVLGGCTETVITEIKKKKAAFSP